VKILVRQKPPEPLLEKKPEPPPPIEKPDRIPPKIAKAPPPEKKPEPPPPPTKAPPVRVVGLSLESTTEGGAGPTFAVGNTRAGETATRAVAPKDVSPVPPEPAPNPIVARGPGKSNQVASRVPVAGVKYENPKPRGGNKLKPPYPPTLRSQAIEDDVTVLVAIDATGKVTSVKLIKPSQYPEMNESARATALEQEWDPATKNGEPMPQSLSYTYRFRLEDE
jgi:protein TonB